MSRFFLREDVLDFLLDKRIKDANVLILGVTFKEGCPDMRNTKVVDVIEEIGLRGPKF
ncbi:MAG TPA: Vi polysaccharide biosynthesis UDP-N-acetylglucosamine C-6 dehydrogenase TviB, partial [Candidatus Latescibacteria bacterium]|nr:Vi polysaccharide biosynthesis UDP-N-acetylglucosamine C-6 dehydrogenase TviB [Candidatus Latescibacterota bacterium]